MVPGITGSGSGRPKPVPNLVHFPCLLPKTKVQAGVVVGDGEIHTVKWEPWDENAKFSAPAPVPLIPEAKVDPKEQLVKTKLINLAYGRSGDKGDVCNIGMSIRYKYNDKNRQANCIHLQVSLHVIHVISHTSNAPSLVRPWLNT